jgi:hypothetical protein
MGGPRQTADIGRVRLAFFLGGRRPQSRSEDVEGSRGGGLLEAAVRDPLGRADGNPPLDAGTRPS